MSQLISEPAFDILRSFVFAEWQATAEARHQVRPQTKDDAKKPNEGVKLGQAAASNEQDGQAEVPQTYSPRQNQLVLASYPNGRGGALRPLHRQIGGRLEHQVDLALQAPAKHRSGR